MLELGAITARIQRQILALVLEKCMFLHHWSGKHSHVTDQTSWDNLVERGVGMIPDLGITPELQRRFTSQKAYIIVNRSRCSMAEIGRHRWVGWAGNRRAPTNATRALPYSLV